MLAREWWIIANSQNNLTSFENHLSIRPLKIKSLHKNNATSLKGVKKKKTHHSSSEGRQKASSCWQAISNGPRCPSLISPTGPRKHQAARRSHWATPAISVEPGARELETTTKWPGQTGRQQISHEAPREINNITTTPPQKCRYCPEYFTVNSFKHAVATRHLAERVLMLSVYFESI